MNLTLQVWRPASPDSMGKLETFHAHDVSPDISLLEMLDMVNERLATDGQHPIAFDSDCREGICGACGMMINGVNTGGAPDSNDILIGKTAVDDAMDAAACIGCAHLSRARH